MPQGERSRGRAAAPTTGPMGVSDVCAKAGCSSGSNAAAASTAHCAYPRARSWISLVALNIPASPLRSCASRLALRRARSTKTPQQPPRAGAAARCARGRMTGAIWHAMFGRSNCPMVIGSGQNGGKSMIAGRFRRALALAAAFALLAAAMPARAQAPYPNRTIKIVVGFAAGGGNDIIARIVGQKLQESLGQTIIIENKVGAGGRLAAEMVMNSPPDGYTLLVGATGAMTITPAISVRPPYHAAKDFTPVSMMAAFPLILVVYPSHPAKNVQELIAWTKANPEKTNYATSAPLFTLATELFKVRTGTPG